MPVFGGRGIKKISGSGGGGGNITDVVKGYGLVRERSTSGTYGDYFTMFNVDRTKRLNGSAASPGGGITNVTIQTLNPITGALTQVSAVSGGIGQSYPFTGWFNNMVTIAPDDSYVLSTGPNAAAGAFAIYRIDVNPANYTFSSAIMVIFNDGANRWKQPRIVNAQKFISFTTDNGKQQEIAVFEYDSNAKTASIVKTINVGFDITAIDVTGNTVCVIGLNDIAFIDLETEEILLSDTSAETLADVRSGGNWFFLKTLSSITVPAIVYSVSGSTTITKLALSVVGAIPNGALRSPVNIIRDDNRSGNKYLLIFHSADGSFVALSIDLDDLKVQSVFVTAQPLTGTNSGYMPYFIAGNFIAFYTGFSGLPGSTQTAFFSYAYAMLSCKIDGNKYVLSEIAE
jgi:hypothetical protein